MRGKGRQATIARTPFLHFFFDDPIAIIGAADVDADGHRDLIFDGGAGYVARGTSSGTFEKPVLLSLGGGSCLELFDFNRDGIKDIVAGCGTPGMTVLLGGSGILRSPRVFRPDQLPAMMLPGDMNGDGVTDILTRRPNGVLELMAGLADGTFVSEWVYSPPPGSGDNATVADFDEDGFSDFAGGDNHNIIFGTTTNFSESSLTIPVERVVGSGRLDGKTVLVARSQGMLQAVAVSTDRSTATITPLFATDAYSVVILETDGDPDFEVLISSSSETRIVNRGSDGWTAGPPLPVNSFVAAGVSRDLNSDGRLDLALWGGGPTVLMSNGESYTVLQLGTLSGFFRSFSLADFDNDGLPDIEIATDRVIAVLRNLGGGTFTRILGAPAADVRLGAVVYDADRDGWNDFVGVDNSGVRVVRNVCTSIPLRVTTTPTIVRAGDRATIHVHALTPTADFTGLITIREGGTVVYQKSPNSAEFATASWTTPALGAGAHHYTITFEDGSMGKFETPLDIVVDVPVSRRRSARH